MMNVSKSTLNEVDVVTFIVDNSKKIGPLDENIIVQLKGVRTPKILVINKIDKLSKEDIAEIMDTYRRLNMFDDIIPVSAMNGTNVSLYIDVLKKMMPEGPQYFPEDMITNQPERFIIAEIIREKALNYLEEEVPHGVFVAIDMINTRDDKDIIDVHATIYCEKESHKGIIIGKNGRKLKGIGKSARIDIENLLGSQVNLQLWVKVEKNWRDKENKVKYFGYE